MTWYYLKRWALFFLFGMPFQILLYAIYPFLAAYFWFFVRGQYGEKISPPPVRWTLDDLIAKGKLDPVRDQYYQDNGDCHGPLTHMFLWMLRPELAKGGLENLVYQDGNPISEGCVKRLAPNDYPLPVSGDALSAWTSAAQRFGISDDILRKVVKHYLKNCLGLGSYLLNWQVSNRSSNSGMNTVADGWKGINQPCASPAYFTSAALLKFAAKQLGGLWHVAYWANWLLLGGWLYTLLPFVHLKGNSFYYAQQITLLNLVTLYRLTGNPIYKWSIRYIVIHCSPQGNVNPMFYCWAASAKSLTASEKAEGERGLMSIKQGWPQCEPINQAFYDIDLNTTMFAVPGGAATLFKENV